MTSSLLAGTCVMSCISLLSSLVSSMWFRRGFSVACIDLKYTVDICLSDNIHEYVDEIENVAPNKPTH